MINCAASKCVFCEGAHKSDSCFKARKFFFEEKKKLLAEKRACFRCLGEVHRVNKCGSRLQCVICTKPHTVLMCPELPTNKESGIDKPSPVVNDLTKDNVLTNQTSPLVFLQTLRVMLKCKDGFYKLRVLIDTGSQRSYILKYLAKQILKIVMTSPFAKKTIRVHMKF